MLKTGQGYRDRLLFAIGLAKGIRPTALNTLKLRQLKQENVHGQDFIMFYSIVGGKEGESKLSIGGWGAVSDRASVFRYLTKTYWIVKRICTS